MHIIVLKHAFCDPRKRCLPRKRPYLCWPCRLGQPKAQRFVGYLSSFFIVVLIGSSNVERVGPKRIMNFATSVRSFIFLSCRLWMFDHILTKHPQLFFILATFIEALVIYCDSLFAVTHSSYCVIELNARCLVVFTRFIMSPPRFSVKRWIFFIKISSVVFDFNQTKDCSCACIYIEISLRVRFVLL